eukprot:TRINITY_DN3437_c0_g2_i1.p1 TRINITY_DN3437_c0_g2~~TRINITY_DN3437_c0_g2_i1.p1  ORF type:complete len:329 (+),score=52.59 TRINITY_DN3437_c0_g2_i1:135-1121(+)
MTMAAKHQAQFVPYSGTIRTASYVRCMQCNADLTKEGTTRRRCAGCHSVFYDDVCCQKKDWAIHKHECKEQQRRIIASLPAIFGADTIPKLLAVPQLCGIIAHAFHEGVCGFEKNEGLAVFWVMQWMKGGDPSAALLLAGIYFNGDGGVPQNYKKAVKLYQRAARGGNVPAKKDLGVCYRDGNGVPVDIKKALALFREAAAQGHDEAQYALGELYTVGLGVEVDNKEAVKWFRLSAAQGYAPAQRLLGEALMRKGDEDEGIQWMHKAAEQDDAEAQYQLYSYFFTNTLRGNNVHERHGISPEKLVRMLRRAAELGHVGAVGLLKINDA